MPCSEAGLGILVGPQKIQGPEHLQVGVDASIGMEILIRMILQADTCIYLEATRDSTRGISNCL